MDSEQTLELLKEIDADNDTASQEFMEELGAEGGEINMLTPEEIAELEEAFEELENGEAYD